MFSIRYDRGLKSCLGDANAVLGYARRTAADGNEGKITFSRGAGGCKMYVVHALSACFVSVEFLAIATAFELSEATGIGYDVALRISQAARNLVEIDLVAADEVLKRRQQAQKITTGSKSLDALLGEALKPRL